MKRTSLVPSPVRLVLAVCLIASVTGSHPRASAADWSPKAPPSIYDPTLGPNAVKRTDYIPDVCVEADDLDCVESVAAYLNNSWVDGVLQPGVVTDGPASATHWKIPGLSNSNGSDSVYVYHLYNFTGNMFLTTWIQPVTGMQNGITLQSGVKFRAVIRTSWVLPTYTSGAVSSARSFSEKLPTSGASRVTIEGIPEVGTIVTDESTLTSPTGKSDKETRIFSVAISDGRFYPIKKSCVEKPTLTLGHDGYGPTLPKFETSNLDLNVKAPHFLSDGETLNKGFFEASIPLETASCLWGFEITEKTEFGVTVLSSEGSTKPATTNVSFTKDAVVVTATDFTYSAPTVRVTAAAPTSSTKPTPAKVKSVQTASRKGIVTSTFARTSGTTYKAVLTKANVTKKLKCTVRGTKVSCVSTRLPRGTWTLTITPTKDGIKGTTYKKTIKVS